MLRPIPAAADGSLLVLRVPARSELVGLPRRPRHRRRAAAPMATSALRHLIHELGDRRAELVEVDQERVVAVG